MSEEQCFYADESSQYGEGIVLDEYNGQFSLVLANKKDGDKVFLQWCFPQKKDGSRQPIDKSLPWKITLGGRESAINALRFFLNQLEGEPTRGPEGTNPGDPAPDESGDEIPF